MVGVDIRTRRTIPKLRLTLVNKLLRGLTFLFQQLRCIFLSRRFTSNRMDAIQSLDEPHQHRIVHRITKFSYLMSRQFSFLNNGQFIREELEVLGDGPKIHQHLFDQNNRKQGKTNMAICFGALGIFGTLSTLEGPARRVSLK